MISRKEAVEFMRSIAIGKEPIKAVGCAWDDWIGNIEFVTESGWRIVFFNDVGELDYLDSITAPDGRTGSFGDWVPADGEAGTTNPLDDLSGDEELQLEAVLSAAPVAEITPSN